MGQMEFDRKVQATCPSLCGKSCVMDVYVKDKKIVRVEPADMGKNRERRICLRGLSVLESRIYHPDRLKYPMKRIGARGEGKWQRISWDEALNLVAEGLKETIEKYGSRSLMGFQVAPFHLLGHLFSRRLSDILECTYADLMTAGDSAAPVANLITFGAYGTGHEAEDVVNAKLCILWGGNIAETATEHMHHVLDAMEQGTRLIVIDPRFTPTASKADWWIPIRPGTDGALALGMAKVIIERGLHDEDYLKRLTVAPLLVRKDNGMFLREKDVVKDGSDSYLMWDNITNAAKPVQGEEMAALALKGGYDIGGVACKPVFQFLLDHLEAYTLDRVSEITEIPEETIEKLALEYGSQKPSAIKTNFGLQRTFHGHLNVRAIHLLATLMGNIGVPGGGASDWTPPLVHLHLEPVDERKAKPVSCVSFHEMMHKGRPHPVKSVFISGAQITQRSNANKFIKEMLPNLDHVFVYDIFMTPTAEYADVVLPAATTFECTELGYYAFPFVQFSPKVIEPLYESKSDFWVIKELAKKLGAGEHFDMTEEELAEKLLRSSPLLDGLTLEDLKKGPYKYRPNSDPYVPLQNIVESKDQRFSTPTGKIEFYSEKYVRFGEGFPCHKEPLESNRTELSKKYPLTLLSSHTRFRYQSNFQNSRWIGELKPGPELEISPRDAQARGITDGDMVLFFNDRGRCKTKAVINAGIRPGFVNIAQGWWIKYFEEGSHQHLTHDAINAPQETFGLANMALSDVLVEVKKG
jgi:anaerobic selenocysteine-containing dehydrogenase